MIMKSYFNCVTLLWHYTHYTPPPHTHKKHEFSANAYTHPLKRFHCIVIYKCGLSTKSHVVIILHFLFPFACWDHKAWTESLSSHSVKIRRHLVQSLGSKKWSELFFFCRVTGKPHTQCLLALSLYYIMAPLSVCFCSLPSARVPGSLHTETFRDTQSKYSNN